MTRTPYRRFAVFAWNVDGDMGDAQIVGPFKTPAAADRKADTLRAIADRAGKTVDCIVVPMYPGPTGLRRVIDAAMGDTF